MNLDLLIWGATEQQEDITKDNITEPSELSTLDDEYTYKAVKSLEGRETLFDYLCKQTNYQKEIKVSEALQGLIGNINSFANDYNIHRQFSVIYDQLKEGEISRINMIELFQGLILKDRIFLGIIKPYLKELTAIDNLIYLQEDGDKTPDLSLFEL